MLTVFAFSLLLGASPLESHLAFQEGQRLVEAFEYEKAVFRFREAARDESLGVERATALVWLGLTYVKIGEQSAADDAFLEAVRIDALVALPPSTPPKILEALEGARRKLREERAAATATTAPTTTAPNTTAPTTTAPNTTAPNTTAPNTTAPAMTSTTPTTAATSAAAEPEAPASAASPPPSLLTIGGGALVGVGALLVGGGAAMGSLASSSANAAFAATFQDERKTLNDTAADQALIANVLYGLGVGVVVGGGIALVSGMFGGAQ
jgi:hypothetical protein